MGEEWEEYQKEEAEQPAKESAHVDWLESRKEWIENFPYKPSCYPTYTFDDTSLVGEALRERLRAEEKEIYENELRFTKKFEQVYRIAKAFDLLHDYHVKRRKDAVIARVIMYSEAFPDEFDTVPSPTIKQAERYRD